MVFGRSLRICGNGQASDREKAIFDQCCSVKELQSKLFPHPLPEGEGTREAILYGKLAMQMSDRTTLIFVCYFRCSRKMLRKKLEKIIWQDKSRKMIAGTTFFNLTK